MTKARELASGIIKNRMKVLLAERDMTVKDFAKASGLHYTTALRFCKATSQVSLPVLTVACETLDVQPGDVLVYMPPAKDA